MREQTETIRETRESKNKRKKSSIIALIFFIISLGASGYLIYNVFMLSGIENLIRYIIIGVLSLIDIISFIKIRIIWKNKQSKRRKNKKESKRIGFISFLILYSIICIALSIIISYFLGTINNINKKYVIYSSSLIVSAENEAKNIKDIKDFKIGILKDKNSPEGYIIPQEIIKENKLHDNNDITEYESYTEMIADLYTNDINAVFLATDYPTIYSSIAGYENIGSETKIIISKEKKLKKSDTSKEENASTGKSVKEPFTILLMGIDSTDEVLAKNAIANGDSLILITFNPKTLNATMLSIPRDSFVPIACWPSKEENKITHAAAYGNDCMINTIEDLLDVDIDYYAKINFKGLVKLVDALGGIDVEVPQDLCTDDSGRMKIVCINEGFQHLDGEGALVLSRNRKQLVNGDFGRGQNQQLVIQAMLEKIKSIKSVKQFTELFNTAANNIDTNLTDKQILSFYSIAKDIVKVGLSSNSSNIINIQQLYLQGSSAMIYDKRMKMELYNYIPNTYSIKDIVNAMKINLELKDYKQNKTFSFSINRPYEKKLIGYGPYKSTFDASKYKKKPDDENKNIDEEKEEKNSNSKIKYGCTDKTASNYDPTATDDDGSCKEKTCGTNEEIGADGVSCVCKWGYKKDPDSGICVEKTDDESASNSELPTE